MSMELTQADRAQIRKDHPDCYFTRVVGNGISVVLAIPKPAKPLPRGGFFDCPEIFHGATVRITTHLRQVKQ